nr:unnamed protein product [Callosobruchus analis]
MTILIIAILTCFVVALCHKWYKFSSTLKKLHWLRQPKGWPLVGHVFEFKDSTTILADILRLRKQLGEKLFIVNFGLSTNIVCMDYEFSEFATIIGGSKSVTKGMTPQLLVPNPKITRFNIASQELKFDFWFIPAGAQMGLLGPKWKKRRRLITPAFHFSILEDFIGSFEQNGKVLVQKLKTVTGKDIDIHRYITLYALDVICDAAMGVTVNAQNDEHSQYVQDIKFLLKVLSERAISVLKGNDLLFPLFPDYYHVRRAVKLLHSVTYSVIDSRREKLHQANKKEVVSDDDTGKKKKMAFLDILLKSTGHDTTSSAMGFAMYLLARHQDVQKNAAEEQRQIFSDDIHRNISYNDLQQMKYLECVIKEVLRLYPPVPMFARSTDKDVSYFTFHHMHKIEYLLGNIIPKGIDIVMFAYGILRDSDYFPDPDKFDPLRFEANAGTKPYSYIPFSAGPRNCIGQKFAMLEMKSTLSKILRNFELHPTNPELKLILASEAVLKSTNGVRIRLAERNW